MLSYMLCLTKIYSLQKYVCWTNENKDANFRSNPHQYRIRIKGQDQPKN